MRGHMKLAKDVEVGDALAGYKVGGSLECRRVFQVQRLPGDNVLVSWRLGDDIRGMGVFRPDQVVLEFADEIEEVRGALG